MGWELTPLNFDRFFLCLAQRYSTYSTYYTNRTTTVPQYLLNSLLSNKPQNQKKKMENFASKKNHSMSLGDLMNPALQEMARKNNASRTQQKPQYSRFKASIKYCDNEFAKSMFSYDWNKVYGTDGKAIGRDHEEIGFGKLCKWILKCIGDGTIEKVRIYATLSKTKSTNVMDYDTVVLEWNSLMSEGQFAPIRELSFDLNGKCILSRLESKGGIQCK